MLNVCPYRLLASSLPLFFPNSNLPPSSIPPLEKKEEEELKVEWKEGQEKSV